MSNQNISTAMSDAVEAVLQNSSITDFTIDVVITNMNNQSFNFTPLWLDKIAINQAYADAFADEIFLEFTCAPTEYIALYNATQGLMVSLRFVYMDPESGQRVYTPTPVARTYKAMLMDPKDILKQYTTGALMPTTNMPETEQHLSARIPTKLWCIESDVYSIRQQQFHGTFSQAKIGDVITYIASQYSIKQIYLVTPDDTMAWDHIIIPPSQNFDEIFDYLHFTYGVYMKGIDWYYTNGILYVYPAYENNPSIKYTADIYNAPSGNYAGVMSYHQSNTASNNIGIVSTTPVQTTDVSRPSAEESGTSFSFMRAATLIDGAFTTNANGTFVNNNNSLTVGTQTDRAASAGANNPRYTKTTDNIYYETSKLAKNATSLIHCGWKKAVPFLLYPGHNVKYHYDQNGVFTYQQGILEGVWYEFTKSQKLGPNYSYNGDAKLAIRADSDVK
jgi:hypothetical protein